MNNTTVYVGMDVHKESFTLCAYTIEAERGSHFQRTEANYKNVLQYLEFLRTIYGNDVNFICGYEAGCLGYTLYHQLTANNVNCVILAPTTMLVVKICTFCISPVSGSVISSGWSPTQSMYIFSPGTLLTAIEI